MWCAMSLSHLISGAPSGFICMGTRCQTPVPLGNTQGYHHSRVGAQLGIYQYVTLYLCHIPHPTPPIPHPTPHIPHVLGTQVTQVTHVMRHTSNICHSRCHRHHTMHAPCHTYMRCHQWSSCILLMLHVRCAVIVHACCTVIDGPAPPICHVCCPPAACTSFCTAPP